MKQTWLHDLLKDLRQAALSLRRAPLFSLVVIATLSVGIGANTAMFSAIDAILLSPLPYPSSERLGLIGYSRPLYGSSTFGVRSDEYFAILDGAPAIEALGVYDFGGGTLTGDGGHPEEPTSLSIDVGFQEVLGLEPLVGRPFVEADYEPGANPVVMLGEEIWKRRYNGDADVVGGTVLLEGRAHEVVGIVPDSFRFPYETGAFQVFRTRAMHRNVRWWTLGVVARLAEGVDETIADEQLAAVAAALEERLPDTNTDRRLFFASLREEVVGDLEPAMLLLWGAVGFVLLLSCMNAANLLLARSASRSGEMAVRAALGATRGRITQRVLCESVLLALGGGLFGLLLAQWGIEGVAKLGMTDLPRGEQIAMSPRMFAFTFAVALATGLLYGFLPAWQSGRPDLSEVMKEGGSRTSLGLRGQRLRWVLTTGQVAIACVLLIGAGLMIRSSLELAGTEPGFATEKVFGMTMWADQPREADSEWSVRFYDESLERIESVPGVRSATMTSNMPWQRMFDNSVEIAIDGHPDFESGEPVTVKWRTIAEDFHQEMDIPLREGRFLSASDDADGAAVAVASESLARRYWPDGSAVGQVLLTGKERTPVEIVGVVGDIREVMLDVEPDPVLWAPFRQHADIAMSILVRGELEPAVLTRPVQQAIWDVAPTQGIWATRNLAELLRDGSARERLYTQLLVVFAVVAVLLAAVGIYGVMSYSVTQRTREIGIRVALGSTPAAIVARIVGGGLRLAAIGLLLGLPAAYLVAGFLEQLLYQVAALDPWTYLAVGALVLLVAVLACWVPARRATRVQPMSCLRSD